MTTQHPSVQLILNEELRSTVVNIPSVQASIGRMDAALASHLDAGADVVEVSPHSFDDDGEFVRDTQFLLNLLPSGFIELCARGPDGAVLEKSSFIKMVSRAARAQRDGSEDPEASATLVFYRVDLRVLRGAAVATAATDATQSLKPRSRNRP